MKQLSDACGHSTKADFAKKMMPQRRLYIKHNESFTVTDNGSWRGCVGGSMRVHWAPEDGGSKCFPRRKGIPGGRLQV